MSIHQAIKIVRAIMCTMCETLGTVYADEQKHSGRQAPDGVQRSLGYTTGVVSAGR